ncbi:class I adenylate-forming enzyme family protein [Qaidamihabitans albus]|uniref:class I adenylate-forming enzyme family protein n=1 Tax=Qaidamihabitans albus TaxID=2795733 RepID=UPI0018F17E58|nr:AMP-binding protein [Qaidamihabitans albus]
MTKGQHRGRDEPAGELDTALTLFRRAAQRCPDQPLLLYFDRSIAYSTADEMSDDIGALLRAHGIGRGDRVAVQLQSVPQLVLTLVAAWKLGAIAVPVNPMYTASELGALLRDAEASVLVVAFGAHTRSLDTEWPPSLRAVLQTDESRLQSRLDERVLPPPAHGQHGPDLLDDADGRQRGFVADTPRPDDPALLCYTSGSSGVPKGALITHHNLTAAAAAFAAWTRLPEGARTYALAPLFHISGLLCAVTMPFYLAGSIVLNSRFRADVALDAFREHRPDFMAGPITAYNALLAQPSAASPELSSFRLLATGGAPPPMAVLRQFDDRFGHRIRNGYGLTETTGPCVCVPLDCDARVDGVSGAVSVGKPLADTTVLVLDDTGTPLGPDTIGEIAIAGPQVVPGYWRCHGEDAQAFWNGHILTGDIGYVDADGWLFVVDRKKDMINASGFKVSPREVEDVLYAHPAVREAAVVPAPDAYRGETVVAWVSPYADAVVNAQELIDFCRTRLAAYKCPRTVRFSRDLPKTESGKILRRQLVRSAGPE